MAAPLPAHAPAPSTTLSLAALEVLGALAPFVESGPHRPPALRRHTHLTPVRFASAVAELARLGLVRCEEDTLWRTALGDSAAAAAFP